MTQDGEWLKQELSNCEQYSKMKTYFYFIPMRLEVLVRLVVEKVAPLKEETKKSIERCKVKGRKRSGKEHIEGR